MRLRPVDGTDEESVGVHLGLEPATLGIATYGRPDTSLAGNLTAARLIRDAARLRLRSGAGPFRAAGNLSVLPRPYQYVPLLMALRQETVRLLLADDVGVGKTIEAGLIARELLDRGIARRLAVICPPHLCDQWAEELRNKFNIEAAVIQSSSYARLERQLPANASVFRHYRHFVASIDFVKGDNYRGPFLNNAPDLVIVDEAHASARPRGDRGGRSSHQRYELLRELTRDPNRHVILVTATPHSGIEEGFRSLLGMLNPEFDLPVERTLDKKRLLPHVVQRRRADVSRWLGDEKTPFPTRVTGELPYAMSAAYNRLFEKVRDYCRESISTTSSDVARRQRVRHWAAIALLRCVLSSPAAAESVMSNRDRRLEERADEVTEAELASQVLDGSDSDAAPDFAPGAAIAASDDQDRRRIREFIREAAKLSGRKFDSKLGVTIDEVASLLRSGFRPIVYCRFIPTAGYVAEHLKKELAKQFPGLEVKAVTGELGDDERREAIATLGVSEVRVLVATDCLSEGINLQHLFDAVIHYDLPWNPNRLEQREGRIDRFGQEKPEVRAMMVYGADNPVDLTVLDVLIRKDRQIRQSLGVSVAAPINSQEVVQAVVENVLLHGRQQARQMPLGLTGEGIDMFHAAWDRSAEAERETRSYFAQAQVQPEAVLRELKDLEPVLGDDLAVRRFLERALPRFSGELRATNTEGVFVLLPGDLRDRIVQRAPGVKFADREPRGLRVSFDSLPRDRAVTLGRNHPVVEAIADEVFSRAFSDVTSSDQFTRSGAVFTPAVERRTAVLVLRLRYRLEERGQQQFAEEIVTAAFTTAEGRPQWLSPLQETALELLESATASGNMPADERTRQAEWALGMLTGDWWRPIVEERAAVLEAANARLRSQAGGAQIIVNRDYEPDILGCYVLVPGAAS